MVALPPLTSCAAIAAVAESPALLRLRLLEARIATRRPMGAEARRSARALIAELRRAIAEKPSLSFVDVTAKLKTYGECVADDDDEVLDAERKRMLESALRDLARMQPCA